MDITNITTTRKLNFVIEKTIDGDTSKLFLEEVDQNYVVFRDGSGEAIYIHPGLIPTVIDCLNQYIKVNA